MSISSADGASSVSEDEIWGQKRQLRESMRRKRSLYPARAAADDSVRIRKSLMSWEAWARARQILTFVSCRREPDTVCLIEQALAQGKKVGVPRVTGPAAMDFIRIYSLKDLRPGYFDVMEPASSLQEKLTGGLVIVPGLAFDRQMGRLGYGGGYYDAWISAHRPDICCCGIAYDFQIVDRLPLSSTDERMDRILTPGQCLVR